MIEDVLIVLGGILGGLCVIYACARLITLAVIRTIDEYRKGGSNEKKKEKQKQA
jgi:hypothetical protein